MVTPSLWQIGVPDRSAAEYYIPDPDPTLVNTLFMQDERHKSGDEGFLRDEKCGIMVNLVFLLFWPRKTPPHKQQKSALNHPTQNRTIGCLVVFVDLQL
ncbi:Rhamnogalacturonate lyase family protein [Senna tora]|uniref:Rhamnogalacturonate lyase family protein n=1 Tax=Senna tora TaxID=362788 RepID=A0A834U0F5_9FABA|nr:Rhamnogalacturonate lyase family protein [Senna tora]